MSTVTVLTLIVVIPSCQAATYQSPSHIIEHTQEVTMMRGPAQEFATHIEVLEQRVAELGKSGPAGQSVQQPSRTLAGLPKEA